MSWQRNYVTLPTGERIRYAILERADADDYYVRFRSKDGRRVARSTGCGRKEKRQAAEEAQRIILDEYGAAAGSVETVTWDVAKVKLREAMEADGKRPKTIGGYMETIDKLIVTCPSHGPASVTEKMAAEFKTKYGKGKFTRKRTVKPGEKVVHQARRAKSLDGRIRTLKAVFRWFRDLRLVESNPFENVAAPKLDRHEVRYIREDDISGFFTWLEGRFGAWAMPRMFFSVKAATGCRLEDICQLRSAQLQDGRLVFTAGTTKNRSERYAVLPAELYSELVAYAGETYLWEAYPTELIAANKAKGWPTHRQNPEFSPRRLYLWVVQIMQGYQDQTGEELSSHDFRRAAFTRAAEENVHPKLAAVAFDVTAETMLRYYTATEKKKTADEVLGGLAERLLPKIRREEE